MNLEALPKIGPHLNRARGGGLPATLTLEEWTRTVADFAGLCAYCGEAPARAVEHFIPMSAGGGTTAGNCLPSCKSCNNSKGDTHPNDLDSDRIPAARVAELRAYLRQRSTGEDTGPGTVIPDLVVRGLTADDMAALDAEQARRLATLPPGVKLSRNALVIMILREALSASKAAEPS